MTKPMTETVAVIGAGQMGSGIAQTVAMHGTQVLLADVDLATAQASHKGIDAALGKLVGKGKLEIAEAEATLARITPIGDYAPMAQADLIIEAATEREEIKQAIFEKAGKLLGAEAILASNTSTISITFTTTATITTSYSLLSSSINCMNAESKFNFSARSLRL